MRRNISEVLRAQTLLGNDRFNAGGEFCALVVKDLHNLLKEYFEYKGIPNLSLEKKGANVSVCITLDVLNIKNFSTIPIEK